MAKDKAPQEDVVEVVEVVEEAKLNYVDINNPDHGNLTYVELQAL